jgi:iron complex outermembrane receptor protein
VEVDATALATRDDRVRLTVDYLHARFKQFSAAVSSIGGASVPRDLTGNAQPFAPDWTLGLSYDHTFRTAWGNFTAGAVSAYKTRYFLTATNYVSERQPGYTKTDATLSYQTPDSRYEITAFVRNIENNRTFTQAAFANSSGVNFFRYQFADPRTFGVRATVRFD